jgi:hypothetical protein
VVAPPSLIALACAALVAAGVDAAAAQSPDASAIRPDPPPGASRPTPDPAPTAAPQSTRQTATTRSVPTPQPAGAAGAKPTQDAVAPAKVRSRTKVRGAAKRRAPWREQDRDVPARAPDAGLIHRAVALASPAVPARAVASGQSSVDGALLGAAALALLAVTAASASLVSLVSRASRTGRWG